jgi:hypothetical protein
MSHDIYLYGVVPGSEARGFDVAGLDDEPVALVRAGSLAAIGSPVMPGPVAADRASLERHMDVLQQAMEHCSAVLPMRFGVVFPSARAVREELLAARREELEGLLTTMTGLAEVRIRAVYHDDVVLREAVESSDAIRRLRDEVRDRPEAATYYQRIRLGELVAQAVAERQAADAALVRSRVEGLARMVHEGELVHERLAADVALLVERRRLDEIDAAVSVLAAELGERMRFRYIGPLAPHSFVELSMSEEARSWA